MISRGAGPPCSLGPSAACVAGRGAGSTLWFTGGGVGGKTSEITGRDPLKGGADGGQAPGERGQLTQPLLAFRNLGNSLSLSGLQLLQG